MFVFIDESGIHNQKGKSSTALVYVEVGNVACLDGAVLQAEADLKINPFHWKDHGWRVRRGFLEAIVQQKFEVEIVVFDNSFGQPNFEEAWGRLFAGKNIFKIIIDGDKPERYVHRLKKSLRDCNISVKKLRMGNDKAYPCLRVADLFAGAAKAYVQEPANLKAKSLYKLANTKIATLSGGQGFQISHLW